MSYTEKNFEDTIEQELLTLSGYHQGTAAHYDPETALFPQTSSPSSKPPNPKPGNNLAPPSPTPKPNSSTASPKNCTTGEC